MRPADALESNRQAIRDIVASHRAANPRVFGSAIHGCDTENSDLDLLVDTTARTSLLDIAKIQVALESLLGVSVDVLTPDGLPDSFRAAVLAEAVPV